MRLLLQPKILKIPFSGFNRLQLSNEGKPLSYQMNANHDKYHLISGRNDVAVNASGFKTFNAN